LDGVLSVSQGEDAFILVVPAKEIFYCFGCHKGGSSLTLYGYRECALSRSIKIVAEKSGVALPKMADDDRFEAKRQEVDEVIELNRGP